MSEQADDPSKFILAVFENPEHARRAVRRLSEMRVDPRHVEAVPLGPGRYPLADINRAVEVRAAVRGAAQGAPLGALAGLGLSVLLAGVGPFPAIGATAAASLAGLVLGARGALRRIRWHEDGVAVLEPPPGSSYTLVIVNASATSERTERRRLVRALARDGAIAFIDPTAYHAMRQERQPHTA